MKSFAELPHPCRALCDRVGSIYSLQKFSNLLDVVGVMARHVRG